MSTSQRDDGDYPYLPQPAAVLVQKGFEAAPTPSRSWRFIGRWLLRMTFAAAVMVGIAMIPAGIVAYRARGQAAAIERLENLGCRVDYLGEHLYSGIDGRVQNYLRDKFGNQYFGDVFLVSGLGLASSVDASNVCDLCRRFDRLEHFAIGSESFRFDQMANWEQLDNLNSLAIHSASLTDADLARIGQMPLLTTLEISAPKVTSAGLRHLNAAEALTTLTIGSAQLDGSGPATGEGFPQLNSLTIQNSPQLRDQGIVNLGPMPELTAVMLDDTPLGDAAVGHVAGGGKLIQASLIRTRVADRGLEPLANCPELGSLDLAGTQVTDGGVAVLARCTNLNYLDLSETNVTGKGLSVLSGNMLTLGLDKSAVTDEGLHDILKIPGLSNLSLQDTKVTGAGLKAVVAGTSLQILNLAGTPLTQEGIETLAKSKVFSLGLARTTFDDKALMLFEDNDDIGGLDVQATKVTALGVKAFYEARKQRLTAAGREESLYVASDHQGIAEQYHSSMGIIGMADDPTLLLPDGTEPQPEEVNPN